MKGLLAVDGSIHALRAAQVLIDLAKHCRETTAHVLNVQPQNRYVALLPEERQAQIERLMQECGKEATESVCKLLAAAGVPFEVEVVASDPELAIVRIARQRHCDFIMMGTRGMGAIAGMALGSVATKVLHLTDLPVTLVK